MRAQSMIALAAAAAFALPAAAQPPKAPASAGVLSAAEVRSLIVGRMVSSAEGMTWLYYPNDKYEADDGRTGRSGTYAVRADGRLCWNESTGVAGCFQYYRKGGQLHGRRVDPGHSFELGRLTLEKLP